MEHTTTWTLITLVKSEVFDCAATSGGKSLNKELQGLFNQDIHRCTTSVLLRSNCFHDRYRSNFPPSEGGKVCQLSAVSLVPK